MIAFADVDDDGVFHFSPYLNSPDHHSTPQNEVFNSNTENKMSQEKKITMASPREVPHDVEGSASSSLSSIESNGYGFWSVLKSSDSEQLDILNRSGLSGPSFAETRLAKKDMDHLADRNLRVPELVMCYRESSFLEVKDICIDEGITHENALFETERDQGPGTNFLGGKDEESNLSYGRMDDHFSAASYLNCSEYHYFKDVKPHVRANLVPTETKADDAADAKSKVKDVASEVLFCDSSDNVCNRTTQSSSKVCIPALLGGNYCSIFTDSARM